MGLRLKSNSAGQCLKHSEIPEDGCHAAAMVVVAIVLVGSGEVKKWSVTTAGRATLAEAARGTKERLQGGASCPAQSLVRTGQDRLGYYSFYLNTRLSPTELHRCHYLSRRAYWVC